MGKSKRIKILKLRTTICSSFSKIERGDGVLKSRLNDFLYHTEHDDINHIIVKYIKKNIDRMDTMTIDELADACYVSKGKISKFCKSLGYESFIAFKDECANEAKEKSIVIEKQKEGLDVSFKDHLHQSIHLMEKNLSGLDLVSVDLLVKEMKKANHIFLLGISYSNLLCRYMQYECDYFDKEVIVVDEKIHKDYVFDKESFLIVVSVEGLGLEHERHLLDKIKHYPVNKWIISTDRIRKSILDTFDYSIIIPSKGTDAKDRRLLVRYVVDIIMGRYQYLLD